MTKRIGMARCSFCGYKTTTGGIDEHAKHCSKNPKNSNPMTSLQKKAEAWYHQSEGFDKMEAYIAGYLAGQQKTGGWQLKKYGQHLSTCNLNQDWTPAYQAMADTPNEYRDESYHIALQEMEVKRSKCTCGFTEALAGEKAGEDQEGLRKEIERWKDEYGAMEKIIADYQVTDRQQKMTIETARNLIFQYWKKEHPGIPSSRLPEEWELFISENYI